ncbi:uncharacterized protein LOC114297686 [Camellia sinensis]|uniref:uncharacterized protein LOC114297686 n=1 Tax=Camellia sinensis TaxID=4442 RepID=UPI00103673AF|nr:uncharacterized protein LOC114297686 [Camellia sinensis]
MLCPICQSEIGTVEHLLFDCPWTKAVWFGNAINLRVVKGSIPNVASWTNDLIVSGLPKDVTMQLLSRVATIGWYIWKSRNEFIFNHIPVDPSATLQCIAHEWAERDLLVRLSQNSVSPLESPSPEPPSAWSPAAYGCFKINCDAAFCHRASKAALAAKAVQRIHRPSRPDSNTNG